MGEKTVIYPGSFDPVTIGHLDIIQRISKVFDKVIVVVMSNFKKMDSYEFSIEQRKSLIEKCTQDLENVSVDSFEGLLAQYAKQKGASAIVKGLRAVSDFEDEFQQALTNKKLNEDVETIFMAASTEHMFLSSSMIKQICLLGGDINPFLPKEISNDVIKQLRKEIK